MLHCHARVTAIGRSGVEDQFAKRFTPCGDLALLDNYEELRREIEALKAAR
jgi:hypothetical protein